MAIETYKAKAHLQDGFLVKASSREFEITIDEPEDIGGSNAGMTPVELILSAFGACQAIVARVYAEQFKIEFNDLWIEIEGDLDTDGFMNKADVRSGFSEIRFNVHIETDAEKDTIKQYLQFLERLCPVGDTIANPVNLKLNEIVIEPLKK